MAKVEQVLAPLETPAKKEDLLAILELKKKGKKNTAWKKIGDDYYKIDARGTIRRRTSEQKKKGLVGDAYSAVRFEKEVIDDLMEAEPEKATQEAQSDKKN